MLEEDLLHAEGFRDRVASVTEDGKRSWVYALKPSGQWYNYRKYLSWVYLAVFFIMPFIKVNDLPLLMINVPEGKFIIFTKIFWPQDFFIFAIGMITFIIFIVLFTVLYGRLFCGWACPQTVFMEFVFRPIEWMIEGSPSQQKKLNDGPWNAEKIRKKVLKHFLFFSFAVLISHTFLAYVLGIDEVLKLMREGIGNHGLLFSGLMFFAFMFYGVFAFVRDIVCTTICPYGRLQGVMFDKDTMQISYDYNRGEPRGKYKKNVERTEGDCINCGKCVYVCPTGIDIRNGIQMDCVGCTACIDACDDVMFSLNMPKGLIRYASENEIKTGQKFVFNNRMKAYTALLSFLVLVMVFLVATRKSVDTYISRTKGQLYQETPDGKISNLFDAKIINKTKNSFPVELRLEGKDGTVTQIGGKEMILKPESLNEFAFFLAIPLSQITERSSDLNIGVYRNGEKIQNVKTTFLGPFNVGR